MFSLHQNEGNSFSFFGTTSSIPQVQSCQQGNKSYQGTKSYEGKKPNLSIAGYILQRLINWAILFTLITQAHGIPLTDLDASLGSFIFDVMGNELILTSTSEGRILYTATLQRSRQIKVDMYTDSLSFKFYEDPFIGCREIDKTMPSMHYSHF